MGPLPRTELTAVEAAALDCRSCDLGGQLKTGNFWTGQNQQFPGGRDQSVLLRRQYKMRAPPAAYLVNVHAVSTSTLFPSPAGLLSFFQPSAGRPNPIIGLHQPAVPSMESQSPNTILDRILADKAPAPVSDFVCPDCGKAGIKSGGRKTSRGRVQTTVLPILRPELLRLSPPTTSILCVNGSRDRDDV